MIPGLSAAAGVAVPDVEPQGAIGAQYPVYLAEDLHQPADVLLRRALLSDLPGDAIVPQAEVGRRGDTAVDAVRVQCAKLFRRVAQQNRFYFDHFLLYFNV